METQVNISTNLKAKVSAWLLMTMVLLTIVPFNLFHTHDEERVTTQVKQIDDHDSCQHQFHIAEEQELCFLCHFAFLPTYESGSPPKLDDQVTSCTPTKNAFYYSNYNFVSVYSIQNKGSPLA
ncbi:MAG: hypothetical protein ACJA2S_005292 [Cyclobacteriaceae bacterium]|jgi:hypothetical protein